jgi:hypothetical protein
MQTYFDLIEQLNSFVARKAVGANRPQLRQAAQEAIFYITSAYQWDCFEDEYTIFTHAPESTGTVAFDVSEKTVTISGGTWPSWATYGVLTLDGNEYYFPTRTSSTVLTLTGDMPKDDLTGESYSLRRVEYLLPEDCRALGNVTFNSATLNPVTNNEWMGQSVVSSDSGTLREYGAFRSTSGQMAIRLSPAANAEGQLIVKYKRESEAPILSGHESSSFAGSIAITGTAVVGTSTAFNSNMVGAYLLLSATSTLPDSIYGDNAYASSTKIASVTDTENLVLETAPGDGSGLKYRTTDTVDMPNHLYVAMLRYAEWTLTRNVKAEAREEERAFNMALEDARAANKPIRVRRVMRRTQTIW